MTKALKHIRAITIAGTFFLASVQFPQVWYLGQIVLLYLAVLAFTNRFTKITPPYKPQKTIKKSKAKKKYVFASKMKYILPQEVTKPLPEVSLAY
jgi:hypothetical protein